MYRAGAHQVRPV